MERERLIKIVTDGLALLIHRLEARQAARLYDLNVVSEDFFKTFLNTLRELNLENLNQGQSNYPAIDLGDKKRRVSFQVTAERRPKKLQHTLDAFARHGLNAEYDQVFFLILGTKQKQYLTIQSATLPFDATRHVLDISDMIREASGLETGRLARLAGIIESEGLLVSEAHDTDEQAVRKIYSHFNRKALKQRWRQEGSIGKFAVALDDLTELLGKGTIQGAKITKPIHMFSDKNLAPELSLVMDALGQLHAAFHERLNSGEISRDNEIACFRDPVTAEKMNERKQKVLDAINRIGGRYSIPPIMMYYTQYTG